MNRFDIVELLKDLPDDIVESANQPRRQCFSYKKRRFIVPTIAACFVGVLCFLIYPIVKLSAPGSIHITDTSSSPDSASDTATTESWHETITSDSITSSVKDITTYDTSITTFTTGSTTTYHSGSVSHRPP